MIAVARAISDAQCAFILSPPSSTNSTTIGIAAKIEVSPSESPTGSSTCLYMPHPPVEGVSHCEAYPASGSTTLPPTARVEGHLVETRTRECCARRDALTDPDARKLARGVRPAAR